MAVKVCANRDPRLGRHYPFKAGIIGLMARKDASLRPLTPVERQFCHEYVNLGSKAKAAEAVGLKKGRGAALMKNPSVIAFVEQIQREAEAEASLSRAMIIEGLLREARKAGSAAVRVAAWTALGRAIGMFTDNHNVRGELGVTVQTHVYLPDNGRGDKGA